MKEIEMKYEKENSQTATNNATPADDIITFDETEHLGQDATIRYLKAKLCVMQEEMEQLHRNNKELEKLYSTSEVKVKSLSDQNSKLEKNQQTIQSQMKKYQQLSKTMQDKCEKLEKEVVSLKSELDTEKQTKKKAAVSHSSTEVRLNRALEEVEKYKGTCAKLQTDIKDMAKIEKNKIDSLESRNKLLEKQKKELIAGFHKQMQMIDILKRQKIHLESARMLAFTEEEFVKALNWDKKD
jgi:chromosome segregation ATPase